MVIRMSGIARMRIKVRADIVNKRRLSTIALHHGVNCLIIHF